LTGVVDGFFLMYGIDRDTPSIIQESLSVACVGYVFTIILMDYGMIFHWYKNLLYHLCEYLGGCNKYEFYLKWIGKPLGLCETCFTGQLALWYYLLTRHTNVYTFNDLINWFHNYNFFEHITLICLSILWVNLITNIEEK
jgi:hypothetical protein